MSKFGIPIIPIEDFRTGGPDAKVVSEDVRKACETIGFFVITDHGVPAHIIDRLMLDARLFFDQPLKDKMRIAQRGTNFGGPTYASLGAENLAATLGKTGVSDFKESLDAGPRFQGDYWPVDCGSLSQTWKMAFDAYTELAALLRTLFADAMGLPPDSLDSAFAKHCSSMRTLNYPAISAPLKVGEVRAGVHTDYGAFAILRGDDVPGLQVQTRAGSWIDVPTIPDSFVINIGDALMRWTNDCWVSTPHRVVVTSGTRVAKRRQSIAYFHNPNADAIISCLLPFQSEDGGGSYQPIRYQTYAEQKFQQSRDSSETLLLDTAL